jgi:hypothetical protein
MSAKDFNVVKLDFLRFAETVRKANTADELRALLLADTQAPYHSYDMIDLICIPDYLANDLGECLGENLDENGAPNGN